MRIDDLSVIQKQYESACRHRDQWRSLWRECRDYTLPHTAQLGTNLGGPTTNSQIYDCTAADAVHQLAAILAEELVPAHGQWFTFLPGSNVDDDPEAARLLEDVAQTVRRHLEQSNLAVELHQALLDLLILGTATIGFEEQSGPAKDPFRFLAIQQDQLALEDDPNGQINGHFRTLHLSEDEVLTQFPDKADALAAAFRANETRETTIEILEYVYETSQGMRYVALIPEQAHMGVSKPVLLGSGQFESAPLITFRWMKSPGSVYGHSPVMTALPDIKTANKVVELILKNASIAATGIWQADDDGVLNPANIQLVPGAIIPKAIGSSGLTPLEAPGRFDVSELVLNDLRQQIRDSLLVSRLTMASGSMTATESLLRTAELARILGATYNRLQAELLQPLIRRSTSILARRGIIPNIKLDGKQAHLRMTGPLARYRSRQDAQNVLLWLETIGKFGAAGMSLLSPEGIAEWLADELSIPKSLLADKASPSSVRPDVSPANIPSETPTLPGDIV